MPSQSGLEARTPNYVAGGPPVRCVRGHSAGAEPIPVNFRGNRWQCEPRSGSGFSKVPRLDAWV